MSLSIVRLRKWFAGLAIVAIAVVAGFYFYARIQQRLLLKNLPAKLGIEVQQSSEGFTLNKSEGGRTLFTIHASKVVQYKQGGRAHLQNVNIIVYGRNSDRFDQIYGNDFDYDQQAGTVEARGEVHIDLEGNTEGKLLDDQSPPREMKNPIHLRTEGLVFSQKTGMAHTDGRVEFRVPQANGTARGATFDTKQSILLLHEDVDVLTDGTEPAHILARDGRITRQPRVLELNTALLATSERQVRAGLAILDLTTENAVQNVHASNGVEMEESDGVKLRSPRAELKMGAANALEQARFMGGVEMESTPQNAHGKASEMLVHFVTVTVPATSTSKTGAAKRRLSRARTIDAMHGVVLGRDPEAGVANPQSLTMTSEAMTFLLDEKSQELSLARTLGPGEAVLKTLGGKNTGEQTVVDAQLFTAEFGAQNKLQTVHGTGAVRTRTSQPGTQDKVSSSDRLVGYFTPGGEVSRVLQEGHFRYMEAQNSNNEPGGRTSTAEHASYSPQDDAMTLTGNPRIVDGGMTTTADSIRLVRRTGEAFATGNVKTTYSELKQQPNGALLATADPVHVTARAMNAMQQTGLAHYTGGARLWQGSNIVEAPTIDFNQKVRSIVAIGDRKRLVSSIFLQVDAKGKATTVLVTAPRLDYADNERQAHYSGGVTARSEDGVMTADHADVYLNPQSASRTPGPSQLDHIVAIGRVLVRQQERRAEGDRLVYTAATSTYVMTGGSPTLSDPVNGTTHGDSLTFYSHDDRVVVEGNGSSRTVTNTHAAR